MPKKKLNNNPFQVYDPEAVRLVIARAQSEGRTKANAAAQTIKEALGPLYPDNVTPVPARPPYMEKDFGPYPQQPQDDNGSAGNVQREKVG